MTIFLTGTCSDTADDLDLRRLNCQIQECGWLINMIECNEKWKNHPCNFMYKDHIEWLKLYRDCLVAYKNKDYNLCKSLSKQAEKIQPNFLCEELYDNFKKRLYTKNPSFYRRWEHLGKSYANYYYVDCNWWRYENGKKEIDDNFGK